MTQQSPFKCRHFEAEIILLCVRWYLRYALSYRDLEEMMAERGLSVDHTTIYRWVQRYAPELDKRCRPHLKACNDSWRVDETYIKIRKTWMYLYRAVDSEGNTLEFRLSATRDAEAAQQFFVTALGRPTGSAAQAGANERQGDEPIRRDGPKAPKPALESSTSISMLPIPKLLLSSKRSGSCLNAWNCGRSNTSTISWNRIIGSSNDSSNPGWASFRFRQHGRRCGGTRV